jgi:hypothetical protein
MAGLVAHVAHQQVAKRHSWALGAITDTAYHQGCNMLAAAGRWPLLEDHRARGRCRSQLCTVTAGRWMVMGFTSWHGCIAVGGLQASPLRRQACSVAQGAGRGAGCMLLLFNQVGPCGPGARDAGGHTGRPCTEVCVNCRRSLSIVVARGVGVGQSPAHTGCWHPHQSADAACDPAERGFGGASGCSQSHSSPGRAHKHGCRN